MASRSSAFGVHRGGPRDNWSLRYIEIQQLYDHRIDTALLDALKDADRVFEGIRSKPGIGAQNQRAQILGAKSAIREAINALFQALGGIVREGQKDAAETAKRAFLQDERKLLKKLFPDENRRTAFEDAEIQRARRGVQNMMTRILQSERPLSDRVYHSRALAQRQVQQMVNNHIARGSSADALAKDVKQYIRPDVPGGVSYAAKRLARTEMNNAFHAQSINDMSNRPWVQEVEWHLSKSHPARQPEDKCDWYAHQKYFASGSVPPKPHPNCLCYLVPRVMDADEFVQRLASGQFDSWVENNRPEG